MTMKRIILSLVFKEDIRDALVFSNTAKIRLNSENSGDTRIQLKLNDTLKEYPKDADLFIETPMFEPHVLKRWLKFEAIVKEDSTTHSLPAETSIGFKLKTSIGNLYWNGSAWVTAGLSNWSTEAEVNQNIAALDIAAIGDQKLGFVVNLKTSNAKLTPEVRELKVLGEFDIEFLEDLVYDSVIRTLNTTFRSSSILRFPTSGDTDSIDISSVLEKKGYNITAVRAVYDLTDDPLRLANLKSSYALGPVKKDGWTYEPGTVTLSSTIPNGNIVEVVFEYVPEILVRTSQDFYEATAFPSIVFEGITSQDRIQADGVGEDAIRDKANLSAVQQYECRQTTLRFTYAVFTDSQTDQMRLLQDIHEFFTNTRRIRRWGLGDEFDVRVFQQLSTTGNQREADSQDTNVAMGVFDVLQVLFYDRPARDVPLVGPGQLNVATTPVA